MNDIVRIRQTEKPMPLRAVVASPFGRRSTPVVRRFAGRVAGRSAAVLLGVVLVACGGPAAPVVGAPVGPDPANVAAASAGSDAMSGASGALSGASAGSVPSASSAIFRSDRYGYRLAKPAGWMVTENLGTGGVHPGDPGVDSFKDGRGNTLYIVAAPIPQGMSSDAWTSGVSRHLEVDHGLTPDGRTEVVVGGRLGRLIEYHLRFDPYVTHELVTEVVRGDRGYAITLESLNGRDADDRALLESLLAGFVFDG